MKKYTHKSALKFDYLFLRHPVQTLIKNLFLFNFAHELLMSFLSTFKTYTEYHMTAECKIVAVRFQRRAFAAELLEMSNSVWPFASVPLIWMHFADTCH